MLPDILPFSAHFCTLKNALTFVSEMSFRLFRGNLSPSIRKTTFMSFHPCTYTTVHITKMSSGSCGNAPKHRHNQRQPRQRTDQTRLLWTGRSSRWPELRRTGRPFAVIGGRPSGCGEFLHAQVSWIVSRSFFACRGERRLHLGTEIGKGRDSGLSVILTDIAHMDCV